MIGALVVGGVIIPITRIALRDGRITVIAEMNVFDRVELTHGTEFHIHGSDGSLIAGGRFNHPQGRVVAYGTKDQPAHIYVEQPLGIVDRTTWPAGRPQEAWPG